MFNPAKGAKKIKEDFVDYITTTLHFPDEGQGPNSMFSLFKEQLEETVAKGPFVDLNNAFAKGKSINELIEEGVLSPLFREIEKDKPADYKRELPLDRALYAHQEESVRLLTSGNNAVITTGTGSGKTECFLIPLLDSLLKEGENLKKPGVRAILIYPMNALANDQMKRLRSILMKYPSIRFGVFNGDTPYTGDQSGWYKELHANEKYQELRDGIPNEPLTREEMVTNPPHIICTNYAMLEYMLLTPNRGAIFAGANVKFVVLDEAHTYSGATGMETSLLIRRLIGKLCSEGSKPQYVLTSATLGAKGEAEQAINKFAEDLTGATFGEGNIVFGRRLVSSLDKEYKQYPIEVFTELASAEEMDVKGEFEKHGIVFNDSLDAQANLYNLCETSTYYRDLRRQYSTPVELRTVASWLNLTVDQTIAFLHVCTVAHKDGSALADIRYHFFLRALEGAYATLSSSPRIFLDRKDSHFVNGIEEKVFEISVCKNCGDVALVGYIENRNGVTYLVNREKKSYKDDAKPSFFKLLRDGVSIDNGESVDYQEAEETDADFEDDDERENQQRIEKEEKRETVDYWLCTRCGEIIETSLGMPSCDHGDAIIKVRCFSDSVKARRERCLWCGNGEYNRFYIGTEAATSVLATALFEELPIKKIFKEDEAGNPIVFDAGKQFLTFSDSRSEAAFFASYLNKKYEYLIQMRGLVTLIEQKRRRILDEDEEPLSLDDFARMLAKLFKDNQTFNEDLLAYQSPKEAHKKALISAWTVIVKEMIGAKRNGSLQSLGFLTYKYLGNTEEIVSYYRKKYFSKASHESVKNLLDELVMTFAYFGAIRIPEDDFSFSPDERKFIFWCEKQKAIAETKNSFAMSYYSNWLPMRRQDNPNKYYKTYRQQLVLSALGDKAKTDEADKFLKEYFSFLINVKNRFRAKAEANGSYYAMPAECFTIQIPGCKGAKWYRCKKCGKVTTFNFERHCSILNCDGELEEITDLTGFMGENYYADFYRNKSESKYLRKLIVREHTAQLSKLDAASYQSQFEKNNINALSCSTTFEMGVDVGELETVFLRDIPPSAANYAQRAGRAGRSKNSAAFVISYAKLSSHDFHYYEHPAEIINGRITPPSFKLDNPKIVFRHIFSAVFGYFFNKFPAYFEENGRAKDIFAFFEKGGYNAFLNLIRQPDNELKTYLHVAFYDLDQEFGISDFSGSWVEELVGTSGRLTNARKDYESVVKGFDLQIEGIESAKQGNWQLQAGIIVKRKNWYLAKSLLEFLVDCNILPKYGFPVDTVELKIGGDSEAEKAAWQRSSNKGLRLSRDMSQALSDYAPGCKVIANDKMYTPRYISRYWRNGEQDFDHVYTAYCSESACQTLNVSYVKDPVGFTCKGCGCSMNGVTWEESISPSAGMITDGNKGEAVPLKKPKKVYRSDYYFVEEDNEASKVTLCAGMHRITAISSKKDKIIVTSAKGEPFYVCKSCGFAYGHYDRIKKKDGTIDSDAMKILKYGTSEYMTPKMPHKRPSGKQCSGTKLYKRSLFHSFATDIVQMIFPDAVCTNPNVATSILYALIDASSHILDVEKTEIAGVIRYDSAEPLSKYRFILFDNVPGGAGHVKRILDKSGDRYKNLENIINFAYEKTKNCDCDEHASCYKCLRTYSNQRIHDILSRIDVANYLEPFVGKGIVEHVAKTVSIKSKGANVPYDSWKALFKNLPGFVSKQAEFLIESSGIPLPDGIFPMIDGDGIDPNIQPLMYWKDKMVFIFREKDSSYVSSIPDRKAFRFLCGDDNLDIFELQNLFN